MKSDFFSDWWNLIRFVSIDEGGLSSRREAEAGNDGYWIRMIPLILIMITVRGLRKLGSEWSGCCDLTPAPCAAQLRLGLCGMESFVGHGSFSLQLPLILVKGFSPGLSEVIKVRRGKNPVLFLHYVLHKECTEKCEEKREPWRAIRIKTYMFQTSRVYLLPLCA